MLVKRILDQASKERILQDLSGRRAAPPTRVKKIDKLALVEEINKVCGEVKLNIPGDLPPKQWSKNFLYTLKKDHEIFSKGPPPEIRAETTIPQE